MPTQEHGHEDEILLLFPALRRGNREKTTPCRVVSSQLLYYEIGCLLRCAGGQPFAAFDRLQGEVAVTELVDAVDLHVKLVVMPLLVSDETLEDDLGRSIIVR